MADALSDIVTLAGAFGSFTQSLATLHDTKVRVEKGLRAAQIERANNDFLQRFNLQYGDPNRLDSTNWQDAIVDHESKLEEFLVQTRGGKAVDAEVRAELMPITEGFTTAVGNKMIEAYKTETQAARLATYEEKMAGGANSEELIAMLAEDDAIGMWGADQRRKMQITVEKMQGSELASVLMSGTNEVEASDIRPDGSMTEAKIDRNSPEYAKRRIAEDSSLNSIQRAAAEDKIDAWQKGIDAGLSEKTKLFDEFRKDGNLSKSMILEMGEAVKEASGMASGPEYNRASATYFAAYSQQIGIEASDLGNELIRLYGEEIPLDESSKAVAMLEAMGKKSGVSTDLSKTIASEIDRIKRYTPDTDESRRERYNSMKGEYAELYKMAAGGNATWTALAIKWNQLARRTALDGIDDATWLIGEADNLNKLGSGSAAVFNTVLGDYKTHWRTVGLSFSKGTQSDIEAVLSGKKNPSADQIRIESIINQTEKTVGDMLINGTTTNPQEIAALYKETARMLLSSDATNVLGIAKGLLDAEYLEKLALINADIDAGKYDRIKTPDIAGNIPTPQAVEAVFMQIDDVANAKIAVLQKDGIMEAGVVPVADGADTFYLSSSGTIYARDTVDKVIVIRKSDQKYDASEAKKSGYFDSIEFGPPIKSSEERKKDEAKALLYKVSGRGSVVETIQALIDLKKGELGNAKTDAARKSLEAELTNLTKRLETAKQAGTR